MNNTLTINDINDTIKNNSLVILYFYGNSCGVCTVVKEMLEKELINYPKIKFVKIYCEDNIETFASFDIFTLPVILFYIDGKEYLREARNISVLNLMEDINRLYSIYF